MTTTISDKRMRSILRYSAYNDFKKWMKGQTVSQDGYYSWDVLRWIEEKPIID